MAPDLHDHTWTRQVTGALLQCMSDPEDVREYLEGEHVKKLSIRRLLDWLKELDNGQMHIVAVVGLIEQSHPRVPLSSRQLNVSTSLNHHAVCP